MRAGTDGSGGIVGAAGDSAATTRCSSGPAAAAGSGAGIGSGTTIGGGSSAVPGAGCWATCIGSSAGSVMSNIGIADGRALGSTVRAAATAAGWDSNDRRASPRAMGSTVVAGFAARTDGAGVTGGGATGCEPEHAPSNAATAMQAGNGRVVSCFIESSLRS